MITLSPQQSEAFDRIMRWYADDAPASKRTFALAGYAGTGKTTLAKRIAEEVGASRVVFAAYTGKAATVLQSKGCAGAQTIHSLIYELDGFEDDGYSPTFAPKTKPVGADLVIVDEYSMLGKELLADLMRVMPGKVLFLGDPFQLPPVQGVSTIKPDFGLTEVHRQALDSNILRIATDVRRGKGIPKCDFEDFKYSPRNAYKKADFLEADQVIVGKNMTRVRFNHWYRDQVGRKNLLPMNGDKLICLRNNRNKRLFNGLIDFARADAAPSLGDTVMVNFGGKTYLAWKGDFMDVGSDQPGQQFIDRFDFGYAITCHKSQGSEFDTVMVIREPVGQDKIERARWTYTAITQAAKCVKLIDPT